MIYITYKSNSFDNGTYINNVWESQYQDLEQAYKTFLKREADKIGATINPHWGNLMNHKDHHKTLSDKEYKELDKKWRKFIRMWNFDKFIAEKGKGHKLKYTTIMR
ncbi:hypothetical protein I5168_12000 [Nonlabens sp. SCSIO 43208]|uniref:hypothetical protein n=1 Tax=Nonlabens sp. SCSIO 43208 TaxID=2793009 RepID=UPI003D6AAFB2